MTTLPRTFDRWITEMIGREIPSEPRSDCDNCVMCSATDWSARLPAVQFNPRSRCCTYYPTLYNHQVGGILANPDSVDPRGYRSLTSRIEVGGATYPLGLMTKKGERDLYDEIVSNHTFGKDQRLRCPHHLPDGGCGIWAHRNATCATWFCRHERGAVGKGFWVAIRELLEGIEKSLAVLAVQRVTGSNEMLSWSTWDGSPEEFYIACWEVAESIQWSEVAHEAPPLLLGALEVAKRAWDTHEDWEQVPANPRLHHPQVLEDTGAGVRAAGYATVDPVLIPREVWSSLKAFNGRPLQRVMMDLRDQRVRLTTGMLRKLLDFDILR